MTLNLGKRRLSIQKKIFAFFGIIPLLLTTAYFPITCPACNGTGIISDYGMEYITLLGEPSIISSPPPQKLYCGSWLKYRMEILLTLQNHGSQDVSGFIMLQLVDPISGHQSDSKNAAVFASAGLIEQQQVSVELEMPVGESFALPTILASVPDDHHTCKECNGTGKVALNAFFLSKKRWELDNTNISFGARPPDSVDHPDKEDWMWIPQLDFYNKPVMDDNGFPIYVQVEEFDGSWVQALNDDGTPMLDGNGQSFLIYLMNWY